MRRLIGHVGSASAVAFDVENPVRLLVLTAVAGVS